MCGDTFAAVDDVGTVDLKFKNAAGFGNDTNAKLISDSISSLYKDLQTQILELRSGCGEDQPLNKEIRQIKSSLFKRFSGEGRNDKKRSESKTRPTRVEITNEELGFAKKRPDSKKRSTSKDEAKKKSKDKRSTSKDKKSKDKRSTSKDKKSKGKRSSSKTKKSGQIGLYLGNGETDQVGEGNKRRPRKDSRE